MVAGCGPQCVKGVFFTVNFFVFLCGAAVLGVSIWVRFDNNFQKTLTNKITNSQKEGDKPVNISDMYIALYVLMGVGSLLLLCGFLGCAGAWCESTCLLGVFFFIILMMFLTEIAGAIYIFVQKDKLKDNVRTWFKDVFVNSPDLEIQKQLTQIEEGLNCCGADNCLDKSQAFQSECCKNRKGASLCSDIIYENMKDNLLIVAIVAICLIVIELLAMIFSCILCFSIRDSARYSYY